MNEAAFKATYSDWRLIKGRKVVQIVFEVPVEQANVAYEVLGGMPNPAAEIWYGVARLYMEAPKAPPSTSPDHPHVPTTGERKPLTLAARAALLCKDPLFQKFASECMGIENLSEEETAEFLRTHCSINSRSEIKPDTAPGRMFERIYNDFALWRDTPAMVE